MSGNVSAFQNYYGFTPFDEYSRSLSNNSYRIVLADSFGNIIDEVWYTDSNPWPASADGDGPHLHLVDLNSDNSLASNWIASTGSLSAPTMSNNQHMITVYPNPTSGIIKIKSHPSQIDKMKFILYNYLGQTVTTIDLSTNDSQIDISHLTNGIYYYHIQLEGAIISKNKIIKR